MAWASLPASSQQPPIQFEGAADVDVTKQLQDWAKSNESNFHIEASGLVKNGEHILMDSEGVIGLGLLLSNAFLKNR